MFKPDRFELKYYECPHCKAKQPTTYVYEWGLRGMHICGSCQIGELKVNSVRKCDVVNGQYV